MISTPSTRQRVLSLLRQSRGWLSGQEAAERLGISRAAVGKHITALRAEGHLIEAVSRRGYRLGMEPDAVAVEAIQAALKARVIGRGQWVWLDQTTSTNSEAAALGLAGAPEGSLVLTDSQTLGRGRKGRKWFSARRSIQFSVLLRPGLPARRLSVLTLLACLAVHKTLADLSQAACAIKWPNDILISGKKVAAVLVEAAIIGGEIEWAVLGIGCNLNAVRAEFPEELREIVTSVYEATGRKLARNTVYAKLIAELDRYYALLTESGSGPLIAEWKQKTNIIGNTLSLAVNSRVVTGEVLDLDTDGLLLLRDSTGTVHALEVGDPVESA